MLFDPKKILKTPFFLNYTNCKILASFAFLSPVTNANHHHSKNP